MSQDQFAVFSTYRRVISRNTEEVLFFAKHIMLPSSRRRAPRPGKTPLTEESLFFAKHGGSALFSETYQVAVIAASPALAGKNAIDGGSPLFHATYQVAVIAASHALAGKNAIDGGKPLFRETDQVAVVAPSTATPSGEGFRLLLETKDSPVHPDLIGQKSLRVCHGRQVNRSW